MKIKVNNATKGIKSWLLSLEKGKFEAFIKVWSGPKGTRRHLLKGFKAKRLHHFLSDGERRAGIYYESLPKVIDYFEQFPLWDLELAIRTAHEAGIRYPMDADGEAYVMTTDLLCREYDPELQKVVQIARSYKPLGSLDFKSKHPVSLNRTFEKLEVERRYYEAKGIRFELITDAHISKTCAFNLKYCRSSAWYKDEFIAHEKRFLRTFVEYWYVHEHLEIKAILESLRSPLGLGYSDLQALLFWGIWTHQIPVDLEVKINLHRPLKMLEVA